MREYLFRGKRADNGEWVEGNLFVDEKREKCEILIGYTNYRIAWEVIPESVGQYTGMKDIGDKRIFEGDIMETAIGGITYHRGVVEFTDGAFGLRCTDGSAYFLCFVAGNYAIIGTVFEDADLLEG